MIIRNHPIFNPPIIRIANAYIHFCRITNPAEQKNDFLMENSYGFCRELLPV